MVKLVRVEYDLGTPIIIQIGSWMHGVKPSKLMVSLNIKEVEFFIEAIPRLLESSPRTLEYTGGHRNLCLVNDGSKIRMKQETDYGWHDVSFYHRDVHRILPVVRCLRFFQAPGEKSPEWVDSILKNIFLQMVEKEMVTRWMDYREALKVVGDKKSEFKEQVAKVMRLFDYPEPDVVFLEKQWDDLYQQAGLEVDVHYDEEAFHDVYNAINFLFETKYEMFYNTF
jgi:hypothetical protein